MPIGAAIGASAAIGGATTLAAGSKAARAQKQAAQQSSDAQLQAAQVAADTNRYMYDTTRGDYAPGRIVGEAALYKLADMLGVGRPTDMMSTRSVGSLPGGMGRAANDGGMGLVGMYGGPLFTADGQPSAPAQPISLTQGYQGFEASPGYAFRRDEGQKAIERSAAARGLLRSGATQKAIGRYVDGLASDEYDRYAQRLMGLAGVGQSATGGTASAGANAASGAANAAIQAGQGVAQGAQAMGNARASSYANTASAINNTVTGLTSAYLYTRAPTGVPGFGG